MYRSFIFRVPNGERERTVNTERKTVNDERTVNKQLWQNGEVECFGTVYLIQSTGYSVGKNYDERVTDFNPISIPSLEFIK